MTTSSVLSLPREILYSFPIPVRTSINLSRTCKWIHKLMNPFVINYNYIPSSIPNTIYKDGDYIITYDNDKYDVYERSKGPVDILNWMLGENVKHIHEGAYTLQQLNSCIFSMVIDGKYKIDNNDHIISRTENKSSFFNCIRLPYIELGYWSLPSVCNMDKYYRIYVENKLALDIAYNAAMKGKQVDICTKYLDEETLSIIKSNNYVNNFHNINLISTPGESNYDLVISIDENIIKQLMSDLYMTDILLFFNKPANPQMIEDMKKYSSVISENRVIQTMQSKYPCIIYKHYLSADFTSNILQGFIEFMPEHMFTLANILKLFICPSCIYMGNNTDIINLMRESSKNHGYLWTSLWDKYESIEK